MASRRSSNDRAGGTHPSHSLLCDGMSSDQYIFRDDATVETTPPPAMYVPPHPRPGPPLPSSATANTAAELPRPPDVNALSILDESFEERRTKHQLPTSHDASPPLPDDPPPMDIATLWQNLVAWDKRREERQEERFLALQAQQSTNLTAALQSTKTDVRDEFDPSCDDAVLGRGIDDGQLYPLPPGDRITEVTPPRSTAAAIAGESDEIALPWNQPPDGHHSSTGDMHGIIPDQEDKTPIMGGIDITSPPPRSWIDDANRKGVPLYAYVLERSLQEDLAATDHMATSCLGQDVRAQDEPASTFDDLDDRNVLPSYDDANLGRGIDNGQLSHIPPGDRINTGGDEATPDRPISAAIMGGFDDIAHPRTANSDEQLSHPVDQAATGGTHVITPAREDMTPLTGGLTSTPPRSWLDDANRKGVPLYVHTLESILQQDLLATSNFEQDVRARNPHEQEEPAPTFDEFDDWKHPLEMQRQNIADSFDRQLQERETHQMGRFDSLERRLHNNATDDASCTSARSIVNAASATTVDDNLSITVDDESIIQLLEDLDTAAGRAEQLDEEADLAAADLFVFSDGDCTSITRSGTGSDDNFKEIPRLLLDTADEVSRLVKHDATTLAIFPDLDVWQQQFDARRRDMVDNNNKLAMTPDIEHTLDSNNYELATDVDSILSSNNNIMATGVSSSTSPPTKHSSALPTTDIYIPSTPVDTPTTNEVEIPPTIIIELSNLHPVESPSTTTTLVESPSISPVETPTSTTTVESPSISTVETPTSTTTVESPPISTVEAPTNHNLVESPDTTPVETPTTSPESTLVEPPTMSPATTVETPPESPAPSAVEVPISLAKSPTTVETPTSISHVDQRASNITANHPFRRGLPPQAPPRRKRQRRRSKRPRNSSNKSGNTTSSPPTTPTAATTSTNPVALKGHQMDINKPSSTSRYTTPPTDRLDEKPTSKPSPTDLLHEKPTTKPSRSRRRRQRRRRRKRHTNQHQSSQASNTTLQPSRHHVSLPQLTTTHGRPTTASSHHVNIPQHTTDVTHLYRPKSQPQRFFGPLSGHDIILMAMLGIPFSWDAILAKPLAEGTTIVIR